MSRNNHDQLNEDLVNEILEFIHFIRTPLASIKIGSHILNEALPLLINTYRRSFQFNETIQKADKLSSIVNNILIEANRISEYTKKIEMQVVKHKLNSEE
ncbi:MAG: hypothetical protein LCH30_02875 [Proteobacteria bacterium]|nr:hypothetical protein [Pseudomonadota bacterium]